MRSATHDLSISAVRADALFASVLQRSDEPSTPAGPASDRRGHLRIRQLRLRGKGSAGLRPTP